jgi:hypothetical protein
VTSLNQSGIEITSGREDRSALSENSIKLCVWKEYGFLHVGKVRFTAANQAYKEMSLVFSDGARHLEKILTDSGFNKDKQSSRIKYF